MYPISYPSTRKRLRALSIACASFPLLINAVETDPEEPIDLQPFVVTGTLTATTLDEVVAPTHVLTSEELRRRSSQTLGGLLDGTPGVSASAFGAGASRPVIRGYSGARVQILNDGLAALDVSADSPDHAVSFDPAFARRIEIVRGAGVLLYGGSAIGGIVNTQDRRIPLASDAELDPVFAQTSYSTVDDGWDTLGLASVRSDQWAVTTSLVHRDHDNYRIPSHAESALFHAAEEAEDEDEDHDGEETAHQDTSRLENSFLRSTNGSIAGSWFPDTDKRVSVAWFWMDRAYGVPGHSHEHGEEEEDNEEHGVSIDLKQRNLRAEFDWVFDSTILPSLRAAIQTADYEHREMEGEALGTRFNNHAWEGRFELATHWANAASGLIGTQINQIDALAQGEEALSPPSNTTDLSVFTMQEAVRQNWRGQIGFRLEHRKIEPEGRSDDYDATATSVAVGVTRKIGDRFNTSLLLTQAQRHPSADELYANGPHAATRQFEIGHPDLSQETVRGVDLSARLLDGPVTSRVSFFFHRFKDYIFAAPTEAEADGFPVYEFRAVDARIYGGEAEATWHVWHREAQRVHMTLGFDWVRAGNLNDHTDIPRTPPMRLSWETHYENGSWSAFVRLRHAWRQDRIAPNELPTASYTQTEMGLRYFWRGDLVNGDVFILAQNLLDEEIRLHTSPIKDLAPLPARGWRVGVRLGF